MADPGPGTEITVTVRYFAAARAAAGAPEEALRVATVHTQAPGQVVDGPGPQRSSVEAVLEAAIGRHGTRLAAVLRRCSFLLDEVAVHGTDTPVRAGQVLDVLPPFAGG